ncbi:serine/threonine-protein phosphatase 4 regulatory subunit 4-like isoform X1 [Mytilus californianus]|uniref:serine/threonine-protein phosphatase 4 regulatory subunit 4-like isoform X1 n=1 Tax=Mytilus californianus TaxID=6549 RepID=UPI002247D59C|nr:serine/threonine-protein phosphatase 4 regulatory subunit 4-like isoform X1 [Mytilus californianus]
MEEIEVFSTKLSSTGENVKLFLDDDYLEIPEEDIEDLDEEMGYESYYTIEDSGQEVQRISVINNLPDLLKDTDSHDECMRRVVPKVREVLHVAQCEMQYAASAAFLQILQKNLVPIQNYTQTFLQTILNSVDGKDPEVSSAWLDTLLDVIELLPKDVIKKEILHVAIAKGQLSQSVAARMACCKILGKICTKFESFVIKKEILPVVQSLCQDVDYEVRGCMCNQLHSVARGLGLEATKSAILPELVELTKDEECSVRVHGLETVVNVLASLDSETCSTTIIPLVCKFCQQAMQAEDSTLPEVGKQIGKIAHGLLAYLSDEQKQWFVDYFKKLCKVGLSLEKLKGNRDIEKDISPTITEIPDFTEDDKFLECRKNCAYNFPAMVLFIGAKHFKSELLGCFSSLCKDPNVQVRKTVSGGFHEVSRVLGQHVAVIQPDLILLLKDESVDVLKGVIANIPCILDCLSGTGSNHSLSESKLHVLNDVIIAVLNSEPVIFTSNNWRLQEHLMDNLSCLIKCCSSDVLYQKVIPVVYPKIKSARALPVKHAACRSALKIIRKIKKLTQREELLHCFVEDFCHGRSCHHRSLFIDVCKNVIELYSKTFFKEYFYEYVLELQSDSVPNVRLRLCSILPQLKKIIKLPTDRNLLQQLETCVRRLLLSEKDRDVLAAIKIAVDDLDKIHVQMEPLTKRSFFEHDLVDQAKEEEEKLLITNEEKEIKKEEEAAEKQKSKGDKKGTPSAKKSENGGSKIPAPKKGTKATSTASGSSGSSTQVSSKDTSKTHLSKSKSSNSLSQIPRLGVKTTMNFTKEVNTTRKTVGSPKLSRLPRYSSTPDLNNGLIGKTSPIIPKKMYNKNKLNEDNGLKKLRRYSNIEIDNKKIENSKSVNRSKLPHFSWNKYASDGRQSPHPQRAFLASDGRSSPHPDMMKTRDHSASGSKISSNTKTKPPSSAGTTRRASEGGNTVTQRRGSMSSASSTGSTESATVKSKGSNGLLTVPSTKPTRKKSK